MINRLRICNFRRFSHLEMEPTKGVNILVGDNDSGKSTILQALTLVLTGRSNGRWASEEMTSDWFHRSAVQSFFERRQSEEADAQPPEIEIELYLESAEGALQRYRGVHNSRNEDSVGLKLRIHPAAEHADQLEEYLRADECPSMLPIECYEVDWTGFSDEPIHQRPSELGHLLIDSRTLSSPRRVDYHMRQMVQEFVEPKDRAAIRIAARLFQSDISARHLASANERIKKETSEGIKLDFVEVPSSGWTSGIGPRVDDLPLALTGQGRQAAMKIGLAISRASEGTSFVLIEEPENHQSHTSLMRLVRRLEELAGNRQCFITTHSSFVLNRLGLHRLTLLHEGSVLRFEQISEETVRYFKRLSGFDTLRMVLAKHLVLVEGPSDAIVFERFFLDRFGKSPHECAVDVVPVGVAFKRGLELCAALGRWVVALRDNDNKPPDHWTAQLAEWLRTDLRELCIGDPKDGRALERQLLAANDESLVREVVAPPSGKPLGDWMEDNKTEVALRILESERKLAPPPYIARALELLACRMS